MKFEIRMTACNRAAMLRRALQSIQAQTYPDWNTIVYDDSTDSASREVVEGLDDKRIVYRRNPQRLGAVGNVDQCMSPVPVLGGAYGCLLEDDNFWFPSFLSSLAARLNENSWDVIQTNQKLADDRGNIVSADETTRGRWFQDGRVDPLRLRATLFFMEGVSNSGLVWRLNRDVDLRVADLIQSPGLNEACRSLLIGFPLLFIAEPQGVYTIIERSRTARAGERNRTIARGMQSVRDYLLQVHGRAVLRIAKDLAVRNGMADRLTVALAYSGHPLLAGLQSNTGRGRWPVRSLAKGLAIRLAERDPCARFLERAKIPTIASTAEASR